MLSNDNSVRVGTAALCLLPFFFLLSNLSTIVAAISTGDQDLWGVANVHHSINF